MQRNRNMIAWMRSGSATCPLNSKQNSVNIWKENSLKIDRAS